MCIGKLRSASADPSARWGKTASPSDPSTPGSNRQSLQLFSRSCS